MNDVSSSHSPLKIGIIGAGFSGTSLLAALHKLNQPVHISLIGNAAQFGLGEAYSTPFFYHLLNVRAQDMSLYADEPTHFVDWLSQCSQAKDILDPNIPYHHQFVSRKLYGEYLQDLLSTITNEANHPTKISLEKSEVVDVWQDGEQIIVLLQEGRKLNFDKVIFALGNLTQAQFPFPIADDMQCIHHAWDYKAPATIPADDPVLIVGTGLSMIDTVLTLYHHQHRGKIYAVSRRGLLPLAHAEEKFPRVELPEMDETNLREILKQVRHFSENHPLTQGSWRAVIDTLRWQMPALWQKMSVSARKQFLRHLLSYWNIHRHRVPLHVLNLLKQMQKTQQLDIKSGRIQKAVNNQVTLRVAAQEELVHLPVKWLINCTGPALNFARAAPPFIQKILQRGLVTLDPLHLGLDVAPNSAIKTPTGISKKLFALGPPVRGIFWECTAVPDIRLQSWHLAKTLLE